MEKIEVIKSIYDDIYQNLALEEHLFEEVPKNTLRIFFWRNKSAVILGKNQNPWRECNLVQIRNNGLQLARRKTGGGAVFHDMGNLNYSLICHQEDYEQDQFMHIICNCLQCLGMDAEISGRNDIVDAHKKKFSGTAFLQRGDLCLLHGTLMVNVNIEMMEKVLCVSEKKLKSKGVRSVPSRVVNLADHDKTITQEVLMDAIVNNFREKCGCNIVDYLSPSDMDIDEKVAFYQSFHWVYGRKMAFEFMMEDRFAWGEVQIYFHIDCGMVESCRVDTDSLDENLSLQLERFFSHKSFTPKELLFGIEELAIERSYVEDIKALIEKNM